VSDLFSEDNILDHAEQHWPDIDFSDTQVKVSNAEYAHVHISHDGGAVIEKVVWETVGPFQMYYSERADILVAALSV